MGRLILTGERYSDRLTEYKLVDVSCPDKYCLNYYSCNDSIRKIISILNFHMKKISRLPENDETREALTAFHQCYLGIMTTINYEYRYYLVIKKN